MMAARRYSRRAWIALALAGGTLFGCGDGVRHFSKAEEDRVIAFLLNDIAGTQTAPADCLDGAHLKRNRSTGAHVLIVDEQTTPNGVPMSIAMGLRIKRVNKEAANALLTFYDRGLFTLPANMTRNDLRAWDRYQAFSGTVEDNGDFRRYVLPVTLSDLAKGMTIRTQPDRHITGYDAVWFCGGALQVRSHELSIEKIPADAEFYPGRYSMRVKIVLDKAGVPDAIKEAAWSRQTELAYSFIWNDTSNAWEMTIGGSGGAREKFAAFYRQNFKQ